MTCWPPGRPYTPECHVYCKSQDKPSEGNSIMSVTEHERALAVMDDDGWGAAITTTDEERETRDILGDLGTMLAVSEGLEDGSLTEDDAGNWTRRQPAAEPAPALRWYTSASADDENHDQEVNLDKAGNPGGAVWASVSPN